MLTRYQASTKIVATLGPACSSATKVKELARAGVDAFRINLSHGNEESRTELAQIVQKVRKDLNRPLSVIADLRGPRIRLGSVPNPLKLKRGQSLRLFVGKKSKSADELAVDYRGFLKDLNVGERVLIRDGRVELTVESIENKVAHCLVKRADTITSHQGVNLPDSIISAPSLSPKDKRDLKWAANLGIDWIALSFVRSAKCIDELRRNLQKLDLKAPIIAKLELPQAIKNLDEILAATNSVMVARGDLAVEMGHEVVPIIQKRIIRKAREYGVPVITATQMLESMIEATTPTRAEVSDIANAVIDGSDALMLSGETAVGIEPATAVRTMSRIISKTESGLLDRQQERRQALSRPGHNVGVVEAASVSAAIGAGRQSKASAILAFTESGRVARLVSSFRSRIPVIGVTSEKRSFHRMALYWGVRPALVPAFRSSRAMFRNASKVLENASWINPENLLVLLTGTFAQSGATNTIRLIRASTLAPKATKK